MIADALRLEVERYAASMPSTNPLFARASAGSLTRTHIAWYLTNLRTMLAVSIPHLKRAAGLAARRGDTALAAHYTQKVGEELGHDAWAERDLSSIAVRSTSAGEPRLLPAILDLIATNEATIDEDPSLYLAYMFFAEYLVVLLGGQWLELLEERCSIPVSSMTAVNNHIELDKAHTEEALDSIDSLVADPRKLPRMREVVRGAIACFERFSHEVVAAGDQAETHVAPLQQVSAA